jgi:hypothetical protein
MASALTGLHNMVPSDGLGDEVGKGLVAWRKGVTA